MRRGKFVPTKERKARLLYYRAFGEQPPKLAGDVYCELEREDFHWNDEKRNFIYEYPWWLY